MKVMTFVGSLRAQSFNKAIAEYVKKSTEGTMDIEMVNIELPYFNEDIEGNKPQEVLDFLAQIEKADAFLFVTPEYNHGVPGGLKNAIDWASRGTYFNNKPAFIMGASPSAIGSERSQLALRQILDTMPMRVLPGNEVIVSDAAAKVHDGVLIDEGTKKFIDSVIANFMDWYNLVK